MGIELNDLIQVYDDVLPDTVCNFLIDLFEKNSDKQEVIDDNKTPSFTQYNLTENVEESSEIENVHNYLVSIVIEYRNKYYKFIDDRCFPAEHDVEYFRIKKYKNDGNDMFDTHVDVTDYSNAKRYLSFMWYLNDVTEGGETVFTNFKITPKKGRLLMFPPMWMFPHKGLPPMSNEKYLLSTYLHYQ